MCNCKKEIEEKATKKFIEMDSHATNHKAELMGFVFIFGNEPSYKGAMEMKWTASYPLKKGGFKERAKTVNMIFTYCPFCGEKYEKEDASCQPTT